MIGVCGDFFTKDKFRAQAIALTGFNSVGGVLVHEMSHNLANTEDHQDDAGDEVYGTGGCKQLAIDSPSRAWYNADNIEYFCEEATYGPEKAKAPIQTGATSSVASIAAIFEP